MARLAPLFACALALGACPAAGRAPDDARTAVFGMACRYGWDEIAVFVRSLRGAGYTGAVRLGVSAELLADTRAAAQLRGFDVRTDTEPCAEAHASAALLPHAAFDDGWLGDLSHTRWGHFRRWLAPQEQRGAPPSRYERVWLLDVRDVVFLWHPFARPTSSSSAAAPAARPELLLFADPAPTSALELGRVRTCLGAATAERMGRARPLNVCAGSVYGSARAVGALCARMEEEARALRRSLTLRQPAAAAAAATAASSSDRGSSGRGNSTLAACVKSDQWLLNKLLWTEGLGAPGEYPASPFGSARIRLPAEVAELATLRWPNPPGCEGLAKLARKAPGLRRRSDVRPAARQPRGAPALVHKWAHCDELRAFVCATVPEAAHTPTCDTAGAAATKLRSALSEAKTKLVQLLEQPDARGGTLALDKAGKRVFNYSAAATAVLGPQWRGQVLGLLKGTKPSKPAKAPRGDSGDSAGPDEDADY